MPGFYGKIAKFKAENRTAWSIFGLGPWFDPVRVNGLSDR